ncbi:MAG TPA: sulfatase [Candidatus Bathyarchaeia archaeon]|nr:sulfatase [Candidatus Bathyarchaeia archaeon]
MKRKKLLVFWAVFVVGLIFAVALTLRKLSVVFAPDVYGLEPSMFRAPQKGEAAITTFVSTLSTPMSVPNIIVILADDLGYGDLSIQGSPAVRTPCVDALASEGVRFTSFYASAAVCSPSRAGLLTGRYPLRCGIITPLQAANDNLMRKATRQAGVLMAQMGVVDMAGGSNMVMGLPECEITIPEALKVAGYRSAAIGKWHLGDFTVLPEYHPFNHGFDHFVGFNMSNDDWPVAFWRGKQEVVKDIGIDQEKYTRLFTEEAVTFIEQSNERAHAREPFFLYLAHKDPHQPFFPSKEFAGKSDGGPYGDAVSEFDWSVGEVVACVKRLGIEDNTLVIVTSDNGPWFEGSGGGLRGRKGQSYEGGFRVPCVAWWPGHIPAGRVVDEPAMQTDFFPTFMKLASLSLPNDRVIDGADLGPLLTGQGAVPERALFFAHDYDIEAVRAGPWKYFRANSHYVWPVPLDKKDNVAGQLAGGNDYQPPGTDVTVPALGAWPSLYNVDRDPGEAYNVAKQHPDVVGAMDQRIERWRTDYYANPRGWQ